MTGGVVCYLERSRGGAVLTRVRLMAIGLSRSWTAPEATGDSDTQPESAASGGPALASVKAGARWVAETLQSVGLKRLACVCVDADGSICAWLSAPSPERQVIEATILQAGHETDAHGGGGGLGAGRLLAMAAPGAALGPGADTSIQALATRETSAGAPSANGNGTHRRRLFARKNGAPDTGSMRRNRYAVLAVPDAPVRVFLDELDTRGIEVQGVKSLWHAMSAAWTEQAGSGASGQAELVSSAAQTTGVVLIEPASAGGRLVWAWSRAGELLAGGTMRLKALAPPAEAPASTELSTADQAGAAARTAAPKDEPAQVEFSRADAGRLAVDWLAWSAQLGHCPRRIVLLAPPDATDEEGSGPSSLGRHLVAAWPGAMIDAAVYDDPTAATLGRLAGVRQTGESEPATGAGDDNSEESRAALVGLSARPGRADRRMYLWAALGLLSAAILIGVLGWRLHGSAGDLAMREAAAKKSTQDLLVGVEPHVPGVSKFPQRQQLESLEGKRNELRDQAKKLRAARPVLEETVRALSALEGQQGVHITAFDIGFVSGSIVIEIPESPTAGDVGPRILEKLQQSSGTLVWSGQVGSFSSQPGKLRRYSLTGMWPPEDRAASSAAATGGSGR